MTAAAWLRKFNATAMWWEESGRAAETTIIAECQRRSTFVVSLPRGMSLRRNAFSRRLGAYALYELLDLQWILPLCLDESVEQVP